MIFGLFYCQLLTDSVKETLDNFTNVTIFGQNIENSFSVFA